MCVFHSYPIFECMYGIYANGNDFMDRFKLKQTHPFCTIRAASEKKSVSF